MSKHGFLVKTGGVAAAAAAHAVFAFSLIAGQPQPYQYLARLSVPAQRAAMADVAAIARRQPLRLCRAPQRANAAATVPAVDSFRLEQLHKGQITC